MLHHRFILLFAAVLAGSLSAQTRPENPDVPGEAGLRAYRAQKARERQGVFAADTPEAASANTAQTEHTSRTGTGVSTSSAGSPNTSSNSVPDAPATVEEPAPTPRQLAQMKRDAKARQATSQRRETPIRFRWPSHPQAPLKWTYIERQIDGIGETYNVLKTPRHSLTAIALLGYKPIEKKGTSADAGLVLGNAVRSDLCLEFFTFRPAVFLPHLEPNAVRAYQEALASQFENEVVELVDEQHARTEYGPAPADLPTRRIRFRLLPEETSDTADAPPIEVADYLIPLDGEWLVVRFSASPDVFPAASETVESFLNRLELVPPTLETARR